MRLLPSCHEPRGRLHPVIAPWHRPARMPRYEVGHRRDEAFLEIEIDLENRIVRTCRGNHVRTRTKETTHGSEDAARYAYGRQIRNALAGGYKLVGPSQILAAPEPEPIGSALLVDEYFAAGDDRFDAEILRVTAGGKLAALAERWAKDTRPWARRALLAYIDDGCDRPEHRGLVKRLFKHAETCADDELMAHFLVAFDGLGRRLLAPGSRWSADLALRTDPLLAGRLKHRHAPLRTSPHFSRATRTYLARRAYRYFRRLAFRDLPRYGRGMRLALPLYRDERLATPARLLDAWSLVHALYYHSPALAVGAHVCDLAGDSTLAELAPAPQFPDAWRGVFAELYAMLLAARSRTVRAWTIAWLRTHHTAELAALTIAQVTALLTSARDELVALGAELLPKVAGLDALPIATWLELLAIEHEDALAVVCEVVTKHVAPARLTLAQCVALACAPAAPVARLGLQWARGKKLESAEDLRAIAQAGKARVPSVRADAAAWAATAIAAHPQAAPEHLRELCDAPHADAREPALAAISATAAAAAKLATPALWFQLTESPYDDVRRVVVRNAERWRAEAPPATLAHVWSSALLAVHRGSRTKAAVPRAIAERVASHPADARTLLPLLAIALRSVRAPVRAAALAALARAIRGNAELRGVARELVPELVVDEAVSA
jgi:hypothetical protein